MSSQKGKTRLWRSLLVISMGMWPGAGETVAARQYASATTTKVGVRGDVDPSTRFLLQRGLNGAVERLARSECRAIFADFADASGRPLDRVLEEQGFTGQAYLGLVFFTDGSGRSRCEMGRATAFTAPGSRVVRVCPALLRQMSSADPSTVEVLLIHELLHSLGLGENPPSSNEITERVKSRCAGTRLVVR